MYKIHEFAELAGVTVKALLLYDRLGLLKARRTAARYRVYAESDLERLQHVVALKFIGLPLKQIREVLARPALELPEVLRLQRKALESKQVLLSKALEAIWTAKSALEAGAQPGPALLNRSSR